MKLVMDKSTNNGLRGSIKDLIDQNGDVLATLDHNIAIMNHELSDKLRFGCIEYLNMFEYDKVPLTLDTRTIVNRLRSHRADIVKAGDELKSLASALSKEGFTKVTFGLPTFTFSFMFDDLLNAHLTLTGIKQNAKEKDKYMGDRRMDDLEKKLFIIEKLLASYIDDDYDIDVRKLREFVEHYKLYLETYYEESSRFSAGFIELDDSTKNIFYSLVLYMVYSYTGIVVEGKLGEDLKSKVMNLELQSPSFSWEYATLVRNAINRVYITMTPKEEPKEKSLEQSSSKEREDSLIYLYIEDGRVVNECDLNVFKGFLEETDLPYERKREYLAQMRNLINRRKEEALERAMTSKREEQLTPEELELYEEARNMREVAGIVDDIDSVVEMMLSETSIEDTEILKAELQDSLDKLKSAFSLESKSKTYYMETIKEDRVPKVFKSLLLESEELYETIYSTLRSALLGFTEGDKEIKGNKLPCRIFVKGDEYKLFYTVIGNTVVVIDGMSSIDAYTKVVNEVNKEEFRTFLNEVRAHIMAGGKPQGEGCTDLIMGELRKLKCAKMEV